MTAGAGGARPAILRNLVRVIECRVSNVATNDESAYLLSSSKSWVLWVLFDRFHFYRGHIVCLYGQVTYYDAEAKYGMTRSCRGDVVQKTVTVPECRKIVGLVADHPTI